MAESPTARVSDSQRDLVVASLREHCVAGRLTLDEFSERVGDALAARTVSELEPVLRDLPSGIAQKSPSELPVGRGPKRKRRRWVVAVMSGADVKGRWRASEHITAIAVMGGCKIDLRGAQIETPELHITAFAFWGGIEVIVPEGIDVDMSGLSVMGGRSVRLKDVAAVPGSPCVRIRAFPFMAGISVRSKPIRRLDEESRSRASVESGTGSEVIDLGSIEPSAAAARVRETRGPVPGSDASSEPISAQGPTAGPRTGEPHDPIGADDGTVTILFSDISDYSGLIHRLGDRAVQELLVEHRRLVRDCVGANGGREVNCQGDGFMLAFSGVARALRCAASIQRSLAERANSAPERSFSVHMGVHTGEALLDGDDYSGHTVVLASRLSDAASPGEVLVSSVAMNLVARSGEFSFGPLREVALKGFEEPETAFSFQWAGSGR